MEKVARRRKKRQLVRHYNTEGKVMYNSIESFDLRTQAHGHNDSDDDNQN